MSCVRDIGKIMDRSVIYVSFFCPRRYSHSTSLALLECVVLAYSLLRDCTQRAVFHSKAGLEHPFP